MFKRLESPRKCAQLFHASSWRIESVCWSFEVEIKTADLYSLHKQRYCILHLFTCRVLAFSQFPVGTYIKTQTRNLPGGDAKICVLIILPRLRGVDIWHLEIFWRWVQAIKSKKSTLETAFWIIISLSLQSAKGCDDTERLIFHIFQAALVKIYYYKKIFWIYTIDLKYLSIWRQFQFAAQLI